jgi:ABC-type uncharacterized transport system ATPase subunit
LERSGQSVRLKVPRAQVTETCRAVLMNCKVTDISVEEPPIEEVVRLLFREQRETAHASAT